VKDVSRARDQQESL
jgi:hypothetical protein